MIEKLFSFRYFSNFVWDFSLLRCDKTSAETSAPPNPPTGGGAQKRGPINSQYVVLFNQRMIKVP